MNAVDIYSHRDDESRLRGRVIADGGRLLIQPATEEDRGYLERLVASMNTRGRSPEAFIHFAPVRLNNQAVTAVRVKE